jgi:tetratricopeptide (TPR) repeat protein
MKLTAAWITLAALAMPQLAMPAWAQPATAPPARKTEPPARVPAPGAETDPAAKVPTEDEARRLRELGEASAEAFRAQDFARAEKVLLEALAIEPASFQTRYNLALAVGALGRAEDAFEHLVAAVERGMDDLRRIRREPAFERVRALPKYAALEAAWDTVLERSRDARVALFQRAFSGLKAQTDEARKVVYLSALDARSFEIARAEMDALAQWADREVFEGLEDPAEIKLDPWVVVLLPKRSEYEAWLRSGLGKRTIGTAATPPTIGGVYNHDFRTLISGDLGSSLRHEFFHALHYRHTWRRGQDHPIWVKEGLCSLVEDYDLVDSGARDAALRPLGRVIRPAPSWRTNIVKRIERGGLLRPIEEWIANPEDRFLGVRPLSNYSLARAVFLYLFEKNALRTWYGAYVEAFATARGEAGQKAAALSAFEKALSKPIAEINKDYRAWIRALPMVPEELADGAASLGFEVENGEGDGPVIVSVTGPDASQARRVGLRRRDVLTGINGRPTRDTPELLRVLSSYKPGDVVELSVRRGSQHVSVKFELQASAGRPGL